MGRFLSIGRAAQVALGSLALVFAVGLLLPPVFGYDRYVITGDSMSGTFGRGSIVYTREVPVDQLAVGDVITYVPPMKSAPVTHRIVEIGRAKGGGRLFRTAGDANEAVDPWRFTLDAPAQARVEFAVPTAGFVVAALSIRWVRMLLIGLPALTVAIVVAAGLWRDREPRIPVWPLPGRG